MSLPPAIGLRHAALRVADLDAEEKFYVEVLGFRVEWRPDPHNLYLSFAGDSLALHRHAGPPALAAAAASRLDHLGFCVPRPEDVDAWAERLHALGVPFAAEPRTHRDGARSCYVADPEGNIVQILFHPPISAARR